MALWALLSSLLLSALFKAVMGASSFDADLHYGRALMVAIRQGVKVPLCQLSLLGGRVFGIDYALLYLVITLVGLRQGRAYSQSYLKSAYFTGKVVMLTGVTLSVGWITWDS